MEALLDAPPQDGITGKLLLCSAEDLKLEIGFPGMFLQHYFGRLNSVVTACWLSNTWEFLHVEKVSIKESLPNPPL